jgi:hypothetical protein
MTNMSHLPSINIELIPDHELGGFTAHILGLPVYGEGENEEEAIADLKIGVQLYIEENGLEKTIEDVTSHSQIRKMNFAQFSCA